MGREQSGARWLSDLLPEQVEQEGVVGLVNREIALDQSSGMSFGTGRESAWALAPQERDHTEPAPRDMLRLQDAALERQRGTVALWSVRCDHQLHGIH